jgi:hypothetical protein
MADLDHPARQEVTMASGIDDQTRTLVLGAVAIGLVAVGWFVLSWRVAHNPAGDAFDESLGVAFATLIVLTLLRGFPHRNRGDDAPDQRGREGRQRG